LRKSEEVRRRLLCGTDTQRNPFPRRRSKSASSPFPKNPQAVILYLEMLCRIDECRASGIARSRISRHISEAISAADLPCGTCRQGNAHFPGTMGDLQVEDKRILPLCFSTRMAIPTGRGAGLARRSGIVF
jgi:hypothetical protein